MAGPIPLVELDALPAGRGLRVCKAGLDLAVFRVGDAVFAIDDTCPHAGGSLANGRLHGTRVRCPVHGLMFELDPRCPPATHLLAARTHGVRVVDGVVVLDPRGPEADRAPDAV